MAAMGSRVTVVGTVIMVVALATPSSLTADLNININSNINSNSNNSNALPEHVEVGEFIHGTLAVTSAAVFPFPTASTEIPEDELVDVTEHSEFSLPCPQTGFSTKCKKKYTMLFLNKT